MRTAKNRLIILASLAFFLSLVSVAFCEDKFKGPWEKTESETIARPKEYPADPIKYLVNIYRNSISVVYTSHCPMAPSCSQYSINCFEKHGFAIGWVMTVDRLFHEADEINRAPRIFFQGRYRAYDPVKNNDFWWYDEK